MTLVPQHIILASPGGNIADPLYTTTNEQPALDQRFAADKSLVDYVSGTTLVEHKLDMSGTNASPGTYVDENKIIKTNRFNLIKYSEQFDEWTIGSSSSVTTNVISAPDGTNTADRVQHVGSGSSWISQDVLTVGTQYTVSVYAKAVTPGTNDQFSIFYGSDGVVKTATSEWQRFTWTFTASYAFFYFNNGDDSFDTDIYMWGAQLEEGSTATDYIPTTNVPSAAPRFDHDPVTGESLGLLIEESRTNFQSYSVVSTSNGWTNFRLTLTANQATAPDNSSSAALITEDGNTNFRYFVGSNYLFISGTTYCNSMFFKAGTLDVVQMTLPSAVFGASQYANFDLTNGVITTEVGGTAFIESYPNGWYRCSFAAVATTTASSRPGVALISSATDGRLPSYLGSFRTLYAWGAQVEEGASPTSYIPTASSTVTRAADIASIAGKNFSSWYNQSEGTVFVETQSYPHPVSGKALVPFAFSDNSYSNRITLAGSTGNSQFNFDVTAGGNPQRAILGNSSSSGLKSAGGYKSTGSAGSLDGATAVTANSPNIPSVISQLNIGQAHNGTNTLNGHISRLTYYPYRLSNPILQTITS